MRPLVGDSHRRASVGIHQYLRNSILANLLPADTILSQVEVAGCLKVSRTPVREALRMLQEEGLVSAEPNYRCRVLGFDPEELELLYASRIMNEGVSAAITVENMRDVDVEKLSAAFDAMRRDEERKDLDQWILDHRAFHQLLFAGANPRLQQRMYVDCQRSERYVYNSIQSGRVNIFHRAGHRARRNPARLQEAPGGVGGGAAHPPSLARRHRHPEGAGAALGPGHAAHRRRLHAERRHAFRRRAGARVAPTPAPNRVNRQAS